MRKYFVLPYSSVSKGAKNLAQALKGKRIKLTGSAYNPKPNHVVINWGNTKDQNHPCLAANRVLNPPVKVQEASNKLKFFEAMKDTGLTPRFWSDKNDIPEDVYPVVCRTVLNGHSGDGIVIANTPEELVSAPLYVKYEKKKEEYRVHVGNRKSFSASDNGNQPLPEFITIGVQQKKRRTDFENPDWKVRNHANGFIYARDGVSPPDCVVASALECIKTIGLDFGAVDVIYNKQQDKAYVLEVNTAPGLEGTTIEEYKKFMEIC